MKSVIISTLSAWAVRILAIGLNIVGLPLALRELGADRFSLFLMVLSVGSWIGFANIGMGRVIANIVSRYGHRNSSTVQRFISTALVIGGVFNLVLFLIASALFLILMAYIPLNDAIAAHYVEFAISIIGLFLAFCLWFFLSIFEGIDTGHHQLHRLYIFQLGSYGLSIFLLFGLFPSHPSIPLAAYILNLSFLGGSLIHAADVIRRNPALFVWRFEWKRYVVKALLLSSLDFTIIGLGVGVLFLLSTGLIGFAVGPSAVVELGIFMRLLQSYGALLIAFTFPLTSVIAAKISRNDLSGAKRTIAISGAVLISGAVIASLSFYAFANDALDLWLKSAVQFSPAFIEAGTGLILLCAIHFFLTALTIATSNTRQAAWLHFIEALGFVPLTYATFKIGGQTGVLGGLDLVLLLGCCWMIWRLWHSPVCKADRPVRNKPVVRPSQRCATKTGSHDEASLHNKQAAIHRPY